MLPEVINRGGIARTTSPSLPLGISVFGTTASWLRTDGAASINLVICLLLLPQKYRLFFLSHFFSAHSQVNPDLQINVQCLGV